jgi:hypothetical protein
MRPKVELSKIRDVGAIIDDSILFFKQNWKPLIKSYFTICGFFWVAGLIASTFNQLQTYHGAIAGNRQVFGTLYLVAMAFEMVNYAVITITTFSFMAIYQQKGNVPPTVEEVWGYVKFYFFRVFGSSILLFIGIIIGFICCVFPGIYFWPVFSLVPAIMIFENTSLRYAFNRAFRLISNSWWNVFGVIIACSLLVAAAMILILIPVMIIVALVVFFTGSREVSVYMIAFSICSHLVQFLYLLPFIAIALVYYNLSEVKEDNTLLQRIEMLGQHQPETDQQSSEEY